MMEFAVEKVMQQPVSTLPDYSDVRCSRGEHSASAAATVDTTSPFYVSEPVILRSTTDAAPALATAGEEEASIKETPAALQIQEEAHKLDDGGESSGAVEGNVVGVGRLADMGTMAERLADPVVVMQQMKETVDIEVKIQVDMGSRSEQKVVVTSVIEQETGHVGILIEQDGGKSDARGIAGEAVVEEEARPDASRAQPAEAGQEGDLGEDEISGTLVAEAARSRILGELSNVAEGGNPGYDVKIEAVVVGDLGTASTVVISVANEQGLDPDAEVRKELDTSAIATVLEQEDAGEVVISATVPGDVTDVVQNESATVSSLPETGVAIGEPEPMENLEREETIDPPADILQLGGDASVGIRAAEVLAIPVALSEETLNAAAADHLTTVISNDMVKESSIGVTELESLLAVQPMGDVDDTLAMVVEEAAPSASGPSATHAKKDVSTDGGSKIADPWEETEFVQDLMEPVFVPVLSGEEEMDASQILNSDKARQHPAEEGTILAELDALVHSEDSNKKLRDFPNTLLLPAAVLESGEMLIAGDSIGVEEASTIVVQLDATVVPQDFKEEKAGDGADIPTGAESVAAKLALDQIPEDATELGLGVIIPTEEPVVAFVPVPDESIQPLASDINGPSEKEEEPAIVGELGPTTSTGVSVLTADDTKDEDLLDMVMGEAEGEPTVVENLGLTDVQGLSEMSKAIHAGDGEERNSDAEQITVEEKPSVISVKATESLTATGETETEVKETETLAEETETQEDGKETLMTETTVTKEITEITTESVIQTPGEEIEKGTEMESAERTEEAAITTTQEGTIPEVAEGVEVVQEGEGDTVITTVETMVVEKDSDGMENTSEVTEGKEEAVLSTEFILQEGATIQETITVYTMTGEGNGGAPEDVDDEGALIGVGSSVERSGVTITEIAGTTVIVEEEYRAEKKSWGLSEPLITPPAEEIIEAINDLSAVDNVADMESPERTDDLVVVTEHGGAESESKVFQSSSDVEIQLETRQSQPPSQGVDEELEGKSITIVVELGADRASDKGEVEELILEAADVHSVIVRGTAGITPVDLQLENEQASDVVPSSMEPLAEVVLQVDDVLGRREMPAISEMEKASTDTTSVPKEDSLASEEVRVIEPPVEAATDPQGIPAAESVSISTSVHDPEMESTTQIVEQVTSTTALDGGVIEVEEASAVVASSANGLGISVFSDEDGNVAIVSAEAGAEGSVEYALDGSKDMVDSLSGGEALEKNDKKRVREQEDAVPVADEKTSKTAKTSNGEISTTNDHALIDVKAEEEDLKVGKKRSRSDEDSDLETLAAEADVLLLPKAQKTDTADGYAEPDVEEGLGMEVEEHGSETIVKGAGLDSTGPRYKKRKIALFLGYSGAGYQGMQKNPGAVTIEGELEEALYRAGAIAESNYGDPKKLDWRRAARTDKGVSAVGQVVSGCFFIDPPGLIERVNSHLPKQIRVYGYKRATASFSAKKLCDCRKYEYVLPVYAFDPTVHLDRESARAQAAAQEACLVKETEIKAASNNSGSAGEGKAAVITDSEMKGGTDGVEEEGKVTALDSTPAVVEPAAEVVLPGSVTTTTKVEEIVLKEDKQISSNGMCTVQEEVTVLTEVSVESTVASFMQITQESKGEPADVESIAKEDAEGEEVVIQEREVMTEQKEVTLVETVLDLSPEEKKQVLDEKVKQSTYKFGEEQWDRLNRILGAFEGHHNFHNFTARIKAADPSAKRYIMSFEAGKVFTVDGMDFVRCTVVGQSFMLHQIRKMIGLAVAIMRGTAPESIIQTALRGDTKVNVPMAPELGLFLVECYYTAYNRKFQATHEDISLTSFATEVKEFKDEFIYPHISSTEARDSTFAMWLHSLNDRHFPDLVAARQQENLSKSL